METPSSTRRITRSQTSAAKDSTINNLISKKVDGSSDNVCPKSRSKIGKQQQDRSALIDITNDSPIVGLAARISETPFGKQKFTRAKDVTPGSGEALLRGQVKKLLQKVEEEGQVSKLPPLQSRTFLNNLQEFADSPARLLAPTPTNTPQFLILIEDGNINSNGSASVTVNPSTVIPESLVSQADSNIFEGKKQENLELGKNEITRSLLLDFSENLEPSDLSECTEIISSCQDEDDDDDDDNSSSIWSIQVNASKHDEGEEDEQIIEDESELYELCEEISKISMNNEGNLDKLVVGKHTRFLYNSDDEIIEEFTQSIKDLPLPTPEGKHLRFPVEEDDGGDD